MRRNLLTNQYDISHVCVRVAMNVPSDLRQQETPLTDTAEPAETKNGWGGKRSGSGRPPSAAKAKLYATKLGRGTPAGPVVTRMVRWPDGKWRPGIKTSGSLSQFEHAWVYVGVRKDGLVKIGMSGNVPQRCAQLGVRQFFAHPVVPGLARTLESMALRRLNVSKGGSEWVECKPEDAAAAIVAARNELSGLCHADPNETAIEAYTRRTGLAA